MKILLITPVFFPSLGGMEQHVLNLAKKLKQKGHVADILTAKIGETKDSEEIDSIRIFRVNAGIEKQQDLSFKGKNLLIPFFFNTVKLFLKKKYDLIHVHDSFSLFASLPLKLFGVPIVLTVHGNWINCVKGRRYYKQKICTDYELNKCAECLHSDKTIMKFKRWILRSIAEKCSAVIAVSSDVKNSIQLKKKKEIFVIPNVASKSFSPDKKSLNEFPFSSKKRKILFIGPLIEEKGSKILLETAKSIDSLFIFVYSYYSDAEYLEELKQTVKKNNLNNVIFYSKVPNERIRAAFIPFSDVVVVPSLWPEPCSTIVTEVMSSGKPVIASRIGGFTDLISDKKDGLLFEAGNSLDLEKKIKMILFDSTLNKKISSEAFLKVKNELNWNEKVIENLRKTFSKKGHAVFVLNQKGLTKNLFEFSSSGFSLGIKISFQLLKLKPDLVHFHGFRIINFFPCLACFFMRIPCVITPHFDYNSSLLREKINFFFHKLMNFKRIFAITSEEKKTLEYSGFKKIEVIPDSVDTEIFKPLFKSELKFRKKQGIQKKTFTVLFLGRLASNKGIPYLFHAFKEIKIENKKLLIVGKENPAFFDTTYKYYSSIAEKLNVKDKTLFLKHLPEKEVVEAINSSDVLVLPSLASEAFGLVLIEAMACKKPVIGSSVGGISEVIKDGFNGFIVPPKKTTELTLALEILLNPGLRNKMGLNALNTVKKKYSLNSVAEQHIKFYLELIQ